jgi:hypothetical protein
MERNRVLATLTHFENAPPALGTMVRALGFRSPANPAPFSGLRVVLWRRAEERVFEADLPTCLWLCLWLGIWHRPRVTCQADDERTECEEGKGINDEEVDKEVTRRMEGQIVIVEKDV